MPEVAELLEWVKAERQRRMAANIGEAGPRYDWFGADCGCPAEKRREDGSCFEHPRARENQRPPEGDWENWLILAGRGWGKTRTGAEWVRDLAQHGPSGMRIAMVAQQASDVRDIMIDGESGILAISPPWFEPVYSPTKRRLTWPNGAIAMCYSSEEPRQFRGPQFHAAWCDELAKWSNVDECWDNLQFGLRLGRRIGWSPKVGITTTPLPIDIIKSLRKDPMTVMAGGDTSMYANIANLAESFVRKIRKNYEGSRLGRQEIHAEVLEDTPGALWNTELLDSLRVDRDDLPDFDQIVVGVDPSVANPKVDPDRDTSECGIIVVGFSGVDHPTLGWVRYGWVLADRSMKGHPSEWALAVKNAYEEWSADLIVAEVNNGGALVETNIHAVDKNLPYEQVHASRGKVTRAEPIATLYQQRRVYHVRGDDFSKVEEQMCTYLPGMKSPDRMDALVWAHTKGMEGGMPLISSETPITGNWRG